jgi:hypothetical protein
MAAIPPVASVPITYSGGLDPACRANLPGSDINAQVLVGDVNIINNRLVFDPTRTLTIEKVGDDHGVPRTRCSGVCNWGLTPSSRAAYCVRRWG